MAFPEDLLSQAQQLAEATPPSQASLRRAVSAAYYAVFHRLIAAAVANWIHADSRTMVARAFDHATMKAESNRILDARAFPFAEYDPQIVEDLRSVARIFVRLQEARHFADYNLTSDLKPTEALSHAQAAEKAFEVLAAIQNAPITQHYLASLLVRVR